MSIIQGDAHTVLKTLPSESVDMCMTSPPYWALRDYGVAEQLGLEPTFQQYIEKLVSVFDEVKRVLKKEGSCWVVIGDTYSSQTKGDNRKPHKEREIKQKMLNETSDRGHFAYHSEQWYQTRNMNGIRKINTTIPDKSLCMIPERFAIAMIDDDRGDDYELNDDAPAWVKQEIERVLFTKQVNSYEESCHTKTQKKTDNIIMNIQRDGEMNIGKDTGSE